MHIVLAEFHHIDQLVHAGLMDLLSGNDCSLQRFKPLIASLSTREQKILLYTVIGLLSKQHLPTETSSQTATREGQSKAIGGVASLVRAIVEHSATLQDDLVEWLVGVSAEAVGQVHNAHRAVMAALSSIPGLYSELALLSKFPLKSSRSSQ